MKVALISPYTDITAYGLRCLSAYLKRRGHEVKLFLLPDYRDEQDIDITRAYFYKADLLAELATHCQDCGLIGISVMTFCFERVAQLSDYLRQHLNIPVVWGGIHATIRPEECLAHADFVCRGEGEEALAQLAAALESDGSPWTIDNLSYLSNGRVVHNPLAPLVQDLDANPPPDYDLEGHYYALMGQSPVRPVTMAAFESLMISNPMSRPERGEITYQTMASRGCPYRCSYCCNNFLRKLYTGQKYVRFLGIDRLLMELQDIKTRFPFFNFILLSDDSFFSARMPYLRQFAQAYQQKIGLPFRCLANPLSVTEEKLALLSGVGLRVLQMGIQTGSERTCNLYQRESSPKRIIDTGKMVARFIPPLEPPRYDIIIDNPYETQEDILETVNLLLHIPAPFKVHAFSLVFIPGTDLHQRAAQDGLIQDEKKQIYRKQFHASSNVYLKILLRLTGSRCPVRVLKLMAQPKLMDWFNRPIMRQLLNGLIRFQAFLRGRRQGSLLMEAGRANNVGELQNPSKIEG